MPAMSDLFGTTNPVQAAPTTNPAQAAPTTTYERPTQDQSSAEVPSSHHGPSVGGLRVEEPRRHPLTYAALALSALALLLSIIALSRHSGNDVNRVRVGNNDCVSVAQDTGPAALYCRTGGLPNG